ncbi:MAG: TRAP transporter large permease subunit [Verrucomicrobiales bacterium]|nr:TRAP transporter large permease subunit [Verrucomicrobiales bacterium]
MSAEIPTVDPRNITGPWRWLREAENSLVVVALAAMTLLPLLEIVLRKVAQTGISNVSAIVQHLTLCVGVFGGALAARDQRLLSLSPISQWLKGQWKILASVLSQGWAAAICIFLCAASVDFLISQKGLGQELAYGVQKWWIQLVMPIGFGAVALRLVWHSGETAAVRLITLAIALAIAGVGRWGGIDPSKLMVPALVVLGFATVFGAPVFTTLGGAALILFWGHEEPLAVVPLKHYSLVTNSTLPSIPLFTLAGYFLAEGGASRRLVRVFQSWFGWFRGGPALVTALVCAFFTSFTGASGVTILALGGLLMPVLVAARYSERASLGLLTSAGSLGLLFPPCLPLILYVIVANTSAQADLTLQQIFLAGIGPGLLLVGLTAWWGIRQGPKDKSSDRTFSWNESRAALWEAKWEILVPVVALVALFSGWATPVEAAAVTTLYAFLTQAVIHRDLHWFRDVPRVMTECGLLVGGVLLILGVALGFTHWLIDAQVPDLLVEWVTTRIHSKWVFLLAVNLFLLVVGCLMDIFSAIVVVVPLLAPLAARFGIDPLHFGILFLANMELGFLTPPVGMNLFLASYRFQKSMAEVTRAVLPMLFVLIVGVLVITYFPPLTLWLPSLFKP